MSVDSVMRTIFLALITYLEWAKLSSNSACMIDYLRRGCVHGHVTSLNFGKDCFLALTVSNSSLFTPALLRTHSFVFFAVHENRRIFLNLFILKASRRVHSFWVSSFHSRTLLQATLALSLVVSSLKSLCCDFSIFSAMIPRSPAPCLTWYAPANVIFRTAAQMMTRFELT